MLLWHYILILKTLFNTLIKKKLDMKNEKVSITEKHIENLFGQNIILVTPLTDSGTFKGQFYGKIVGRLRTRFKQYIFAPLAPFVSFYFSVSDVEKIEKNDDVFILRIGINPASEAPIKRKRKTKKNTKKNKSKKAPVIDLTNNVIEVSPQANSEASTRIASLI